MLRARWVVAVCASTTDRSNARRNSSDAIKVSVLDAMVSTCTHVIARTLVRTYLVVVDLHVDVTWVTVVAPHGDHALYTVAAVDDQVVRQVEHRLLPVGVLLARTGAQDHRNVARRKAYIKPENKCVHVVFTLRNQHKLTRKVQVLDTTSVQIEAQNTARSRIQSLLVNDVNQRLLKQVAPHYGKVETISVTPGVQLVTLIPDE